MISFVDRDDPVLRKKAAEVPVEEITSKKIQKILKDMSELLATQNDGVAIAAPQVGLSLRIFIVSGTVLKLADPKYKGEERDLVFINPVITKLSRDKIEVEEGCLSVRWKYGKIIRSSKATLKAYDENGVLFERGASGLLAQVFQHETDHLEGILFTDSAYEVRDIPPEELEAMQNDNHIDHDYGDA